MGSGPRYSSSTPGGSSTDIQFNDGGVFGGFGDWDGTTMTVSQFDSTGSGGVCYYVANGCAVRGKGTLYIDGDTGGSGAINYRATTHTFTGTVNIAAVSLSGDLTVSKGNPYVLVDATSGIPGYRIGNGSNQFHIEVGRNTTNGLEINDNTAGNVSRFVVEATTGNVGIGGATTPDTALEVDGAITLDDNSAPSDPATSKANIWVSGDGHLRAKIHDGTSSAAFILNRLRPTATKTSAYTAVVGDLVTVDVSGGTDVAITFPAASLSAGDEFGIQLTSDHATAKCTVALNGHTIRNGDRTAGQMSLCLEGDILVFRYDGSTLQVDEGGLASHEAYVREDAVQTVTHNTWELLEFDTIDWDIGGLANATNDTITVRRDGKYHIMVASYFPSYTTSDTFNVGANKNNATVSTGLIVWDHRQDKSVKAIGEVELSAGDVVRGGLYQHDGSAANNDLGHASATYAQNAIYIKEVR